MHCLSQQVNHLLESRRLRPEIALAGSQLSHDPRNMVARLDRYFNCARK